MINPFVWLTQSMPMFLCLCSYCGFNVLCPFRDGEAVMTYVGATGDALSFNLGMLFLYMCFFRFVAYVALRYHSTRLTSA